MLGRLAFPGMKGTPKHNPASASQAAALVHMIGEAQLTPVQKCDLTTAVMELEWADTEHMNNVVGALRIEPDQLAALAKRRRNQQDYTALMSYGTDAFWAEMTQPGVPPASKLHRLCTLALKLGMRCPTEPTIKWMTSVWLCSVHSRSELAGLDVSAKMAFLKHVKSTWHGIAKRVGPPISYVDKLPLNPLPFVRDNPRMWADACGAEIPAEPLLDNALVTAFDQSYGCRGSSRVVEFQSHRPQSSPLAVANVGGIHMSPDRRSSGGWERVAGQFISQMNAMASAQQRMLEMVLANQGGGGVDLRALTAGSASSGVNRRPTIALLPAPAAVEELPPCPAPAASAEAGSGLELAVPMPPPPLPPPAFDSALEEMLDSLAARKKEKAEAAKAKAKVAAPPAPAADPAAETAIALLSPTPAAGPAAGKPKSAAGKPKGAAGKAKAVEGKAVAGKPKAKAVAAKPKAAACKPKGAAKAEADAGEPLILGCSKCRHSESGCAQCQNPAFKGNRWNPTI